MNAPLYEFPVRSFHFRKDEIQDLVATLDLAVEGYDEYNANYLTKTIETDLIESVMKLVKNTIARKQEVDCVRREQEF